MKKIISEINSILWQKTKLTPRNICICALSVGQDSVSFKKTMEYKNSNFAF